MTASESLHTYCYRIEETGEIVELSMTIATMRRRQRENGFIVLDDGRLARRDFKAEYGAGSRHASGEHYPITPDSCGVNPEQIPEAEAQSRTSGVPTHFTRDGQPIITSPTHYRRYLRSIGMYHRNAGYSDCAPQNR